MTIETAELVVAGGSFAGLAVARALRGRDVVLVEPHPIGAFPKSACALPLTTVEAFDAEDAILERHQALVLHFEDHAVELHCAMPFVTIDYGRFCQRLLEAAAPRLYRARALAFRPSRVVTDRGEIACRVAVDATGPAAVLASSVRPSYVRRGRAGAGLETELPRPASFPEGLHFFFDRDLPPGYAWAFGCGSVVRFGVGTFAARPHGRKLATALTRFLDRFGLQPQATHGGLVPLALRNPVLGNLFVVGDAAGQVLPLSAEGIRPALWYGDLLGGLLQQALARHDPLAAVATAYRRSVGAHRRGYLALTAAQAFLPSLFRHLPPRLAGHLLAEGGAQLMERLLARYLAAFALPLPLGRGGAQRPGWRLSAGDAFPLASRQRPRRRDVDCRCDATSSEAARRSRTSRP